jgi:hypothetical protein
LDEQVFSLPLQESIAQHGADKHHQWQGNMTVLILNHGIIQSISTLTAVIRLMINFDVDNPRDCLRQEVKWTVAIHYQLFTLSALDSDRVHHLPLPLLPEKDTYCQQDGNE